LKNPDDNELKNKLYCILSDYAAEGVWGFEKVYTVEETAANDNLSGNFSFVLETDDYTEFDNAWTGNYAVPCNKTLTSRRNGAHGFHPSKGPNPTFIGCGPHFKKGVEISEARLVDQAPTYAAILGLNLGETDGKPIVELLN